MRAVVGVAFLWLVAAVTAQDNGKGNQEIVNDPKQGLEMRRPPKQAGQKDNLWKCTKDGRWYKESICITHIMDDVSAEATAQFPEEGKQFPELKEILKDLIDKYNEKTQPKDGKDPEWKEFKILARKEREKFTGAGIGNPAGAYLEARITAPDDSQFELRQWVFMKGSGLYYFVIKCFKGNFEKHARDLAIIMNGLKLIKRDKR